MSAPFVVGNAEEEQHQVQRRGWFVGHFIDCAAGLHCGDQVEVKWGIHAPGEQRLVPSAYDKATTLALLVSGKFAIEFPDLDVDAITLARRGDYVIYGPGVSHTWKAIDDSIVLTVRWPSVHLSSECESGQSDSPLADEQDNCSST